MESTAWPNLKVAAVRNSLTDRERTYFVRQRMFLAHSGRKCEICRVLGAHRHGFGRSPSGKSLETVTGDCLLQGKIFASSHWYIACTLWWEFPRRPCEMHQTDAATSGAPTSDPAICKSRWFSSTQLRGPVLKCGHRRKRWGRGWQAG